MNRLGVSSQTSKTPQLQQEPPTATPAWTAPQIATATLAVVLTASNLFLLIRSDRMQNEIDVLRSSVRTDLVAIKADSKRTSDAYAAHVNGLRQQIEETGERSVQAATLASTQATSAAKKYSDQLAAQLASQQRQQVELHQLLSSQLGEMQLVAEETEERVSGIATDVTSVRGEVAETKSELERTLNDLRSVRGDLGVQSGLIATNAKELAALRTLGEKYYFEFSLKRSKQPQRVGDVAVQLKKSDGKRNRYTIELIADDKRVEKKDRTVNEPVQFYVTGSRVPYEIVVNEVQKDRIVGYLATPKAKETRH